MKFNRAFLFVISLLFILTFSENAICQVTVDPVGITIAVEVDDSIAVEMILTNQYEEEVAFSIDFDEPPEEEERGFGPRRDQPEGRFALFQDTETFGWVDQYVFGVIDDLDYEWFQNADDLVEVDLDDFTALWVETGNQSAQYHQNWDNNLELFEDYVSHGGGLDYIWDPQDGMLAPGLGEGGDEENWLVDQMGWQENQRFPGGSFTHVTYPDDNLDNIEDCNWYQVIAVGDQNQNNAIVIYEYGRGHVIVSGSPCGHQWRNHNVEGRWGSCGETLLEWMSLLSKPGWIMTDPEEGIIGAEDSEVVNVVFNPIDIEDGVYEMRILIELEEVNGDERDQLEQTLIEISAVMSLASPTADLTGVVTDAATNATIEDAKIAMDAYIIERFTDGEGVYSFTDLPLQAYELTFTATDYLPLVEIFDPDAEQEYELDVAMLHSECNLDREVINEELPLESETHVGFRVTNDGNGDLDYIIERRLLGAANTDPWELRGAYNSSQTLEDERLEGVVFDGENFYIAGSNMWNRVDGDNMIYVVDREGEPVREFVQVGESNSGMKDLAWDGDLIWGSGEANVYGFTSDGQLEATFRGPENINQALTWDPVRGWFWISSITSDITGMDSNGERHGDLDRHGFRIYGLAYWLEDPDDYPLYIFHSPDADTRMVHKMNPDNGDTMFVAHLDPESGGRSGGAFITNQLDVYSWVFVSLINDGNDDQVQIWQLDARKDWMVVDPAEGIIEDGLSTDFDLLLSSRGLPPVLFEGELVFLHNGVAGETHLPVNLTVIYVPPPPQPPSDFNLLEPANDDTLSLDSVQTFIWEASIDPNPEDVVSYLIWFQALDDSICFAVEDTTWDARPDTLLAGFDLDSPVTWWVDAVSDPDVVECNERFIFHIVLSGVDVSERIIPAEFAIRSVHPNPFNAQATVSYSLNRSGHTWLTVFDFAGREVSVYDYGVKQAGYHSAVIDAGALPSGLYIVQLTSGADVRQAKLVCIK